MCSLQSVLILYLTTSGNSRELIVLCRGKQPFKPPHLQRISIKSWHIFSAQVLPEQKEQADANVCLPQERVFMPKGRNQSLCTQIIQLGGVASLHGASLFAWKLCWCLGAVQSRGIIHVQYPALYGLYFHTYHSLHTENFRQTCSTHTQPCIHEYRRERSFPSKEDPFGWEVGWQGFGCRGIVRFLSFGFLYIYIYILREEEKAMAPHSNTLAWKIPWTEEPDRLQSMGR